MSLEKITVTDKIEVLENGVLQIREALRIVEDGKIISQKFHRYCITPIDQVSENTDQKILDVISAIHTPKVIEEYRALMPIIEE